MSDVPHYDIIYIGAGFATVTAFYQLRDLGLTCRIYERESRSGGVWVPNAYPGARCDSDTPMYQLFSKEFWEDYHFTERYPSRDEICEYFDHIDKKIGFSQHAEYSTAVKTARFDANQNIWRVTLASGQSATCKWLVPNVGFASKAYIPDIPGKDVFKGFIAHTAHWPQHDGPDLVDKRIAVIGSGASGVQVVQSCSKDAKQLTSYQRTPNMCLPMAQEVHSEEFNRARKQAGFVDDAFAMALDTYCGVNYDFQTTASTDFTKEERQAFYEDLFYRRGGLRFWLATYNDIYVDTKANLEAYEFWRDATRKRIDDPRKRDILAPMVPPHPWGTKRPSLEQHYFDSFNLPNVDLVSLVEDPIEKITETGILSKSGQHREFDVIVLATGFDAVSGSLAGEIDIRNEKGESIADHWASGVKTSLGMTLAGFPNMFFLYGPQAPTAFSNGPSCCQVQSEWLSKMLTQANERSIKRIEPTREAEDFWAQEVRKEWDCRLFSSTPSWYSGGNIPGKRVEPLNYAGGFPLYKKALNAALDPNYAGWKTLVA